MIFCWALLKDGDELTTLADWLRRAAPDRPPLFHVREAPFQVPPPGFYYQDIEAPDSWERLLSFCERMEAAQHQIDVDLLALAADPNANG